MIGNEKLNKIALAGLFYFILNIYIWSFFYRVVCFWISFRRINNRIFTYLYPHNIFIDTSFFGDDYQIIKIKKVLNVLLFFFY